METTPIKLPCAADLICADGIMKNIRVPAGIRNVIMAEANRPASISHYVSQTKRIGIDDDVNINEFIDDTVTDDVIKSIRSNLRPQVNSARMALLAFDHAFVNLIEKIRMINHTTEKKLVELVPGLRDLTRAKKHERVYGEGKKATITKEDFAKLKEGVVKRVAS